MKKIFVLVSIMFLGVVTTSCVNMFAVKELNESAQKYIENGDYESAIARLESSVDLDSSFYETRYNLAVAYLKVNQCDKALENIDLAIKLSKKEESSSYYTKAIALSCLADNIYQKKNEDGENEQIEYTDNEAKISAANKYIEYLTQANENFQKYISLEPNSGDIGNIQTEIDRNNEEISKKRTENSLDD